ncbi:beta strand repeat-containing protein [Bizionia sediminis]|uniref:Beta strand repeat-containing protein n=1 Tax=Bizionia sediminis TaxID=1737064 RepID=A0ABW5KT17_9FLAO
MNPFILSRSIVHTLILCFTVATAFAQKTQKIGDNPYSINPKAVLELESTTKGFLLPRMTESQMNAITGPAEGMMVFCTNCGIANDGELRIAYNNVWQTFKGDLKGNVVGNLTGNITETSVIANGVTATTQAAGDSSTKVATTAFVTSAASSSNFVNLTTAQTIAGAKTFETDLIVQGMTVGVGAGDASMTVYNTALGLDALKENTSWGNTAIGRETLTKSTNSTNTAVGYQALKISTQGSSNVAIGSRSMAANTIGRSNTATGANAMRSNTDGSNNTATGDNSMYSNTTGSQNSAVGQNALRTNTTGNQNTAIGNSADVSSNNLTNATAIGYNAKVATSNTIQLGDTDITHVKTSGTLTTGAITIPNTDGTSGQVLATNGAGILAWSTPSTEATSYSGILPLANGGTGSATKNFVDLTTAQTIAGAKTFSNALTAASFVKNGGTPTQFLKADGSVDATAYAPMASPALTGTPTAPTASAGTNSTQIATTAFVTNAQATNANLTGPITSSGNATSVASQTGTGSKFVMDTAPTLVTPVLGVATATSVNGTAIPSSKTLVVTTDKISALSATTSTELAGVISDETGTGSLVLSASPTFTGTPTAPTAIAGTSTTQLATTAFVSAAASSSKFVDLTTAQTIAGAKTFSSDMMIGTLTIGKGSGGDYTSVVMGTDALAVNTSGDRNTAIGTFALKSTTTGMRNTAIGYNTLETNTTGSYNTSIGAFSGPDAANPALVNSTAIGYNAKVTNSNTIQLGNTAVTEVRTSGLVKGNAFHATGPNNTGLEGGYLVWNLLQPGTTDATRDGYTSIVNNKGTSAGGFRFYNVSTTVEPTIAPIVEINASGSIKAGAVTYPSTHNSTAGQVLTTNASGVASWGSAAPSVREVADEFTATLNQTSFTLTQTPSANSKVKMYVNGIRISNTAYTISGATVTYIPANNGLTVLAVTDRIQFDYFY